MLADADSRTLTILWVQTSNELAIIARLVRTAVGSYRDFLIEEIDVNRFMLYREECLPLLEGICLHNENILSKIKQLEIELSDFEDHLAA